MNAISLLTIVKGRESHLNNLLRGVSSSDTPPDEVVIVHMNEPAFSPLHDPGVPVRRLSIYDLNDPLPLSQARNKAAAVAEHDTLIFLDVDCIPSPTLISSLGQQVRHHRGLVMGTVRYLSDPLDGQNWKISELPTRSVAHPRRPALDGPLQPSAQYHLFWSLCFGIRRQEFERIGGFDTNYRGYGAEDTDFAFSSEKARIPFFLSQAEAYHQYHGTCSPPFNRFDDIIRNATTFWHKWGSWPMEGWLGSFQEAGLISWEQTGITILRQPDEEMIAGSRSEAPFV